MGARTLSMSALSAPSVAPRGTPSPQGQPQERVLARTILPIGLGQMELAAVSCEFTGNKIINETFAVRQLVKLNTFKG